MANTSKLIDPKVIKFLSGRDMQVKFQGNDMKTNNVQIFLPAEMETAEDAIEINAIRGALDHETAHVEETDFTVAKGLGNRRFGCVNLLEDTRIDAIRRTQGKGFILNHEALNTWLGKKAVAALEKSEGEIGVRDDLLAAFDMIERIEGYKNPLAAHMTDNARKMADAAEHIFQQASLAADTSEIIPLAEQLDKMWYGDPEEEPPKQPSESDDSDDDNGDSESGDQDSNGDDDTSSDSADNENDSDGSGDGDTEDQDSGDSEGDTGSEPDVEGDDQESGNDSDGDGNGDSDEDEEVRSPKKESAKPENTEAGGKPTFTKIDVDKEDASLLDTFEMPPLSGMDHHGVYTFDTSVDSIVYADTDRDTYEQVKTKIASLINGVKQDFIGSILTETRSRFNSKQYSGKVDTRRLATLQSDIRVFKRRSPKQDIDTAITYLIDLSGSMAGRKIDMARSSAILLEEVTDRVGIPSEVLGYTTNTRVASNKSLTRTAGNMHVIFKDFTESYKRVKDRFGAIGTRGHKGIKYGYENCDGEAVLWAGRRLFARKEKRRILVVLNDGYPSTSLGHGYSHDDLNNHLRESVKLLRLVGMEIYAFGLEHDPSVFYGSENTVVLESYDDFNRRFFQNFMNIIKKGIHR